MKALFSDSDIVSTYTRAEAIEDGFLVDVSTMANEAGFNFPVALTRAVWEGCVAWAAEDANRQIYQDEEGRLWDVVYMAANNAKNNPDKSTFLYEMYRVPRGGRGRKARRVTLKASIGPGDNGEPVVTIMEPNED